MRKFLLSSVAASALVLGAQNAQADDAFLNQRYWYATLFAGVGLPERVGFTHDAYIYNTALKTGFTVGGAIGTELVPGLRGELEFSYMHYTAKNYTYFAGQNPAGFADGPANLYFLLANLWKDFDLGNGITPYVGGGLGVGVADVNIEVFTPPEPDIDDAGVGLAAQLGAGVRFPLYDNVTLDLSYRFKALVGTTILGDKVDQDDHAKASFYSHIFQAGLSFDFGGLKSQDVMTLGGGNDPNWYVSLFGGLTVPEDVGIDNYSYTYILRMKNGFTVGGAVGTELTENLRGELEFSYQNYAGKDSSAYRNAPHFPVGGNTDLYYFLANMWKDVPLGHGFTPYIGGGIGVGLVSTNLDSAGLPLFEKDDLDIGLAAQFGIGIRYALSGPWTIDAGYRFKGVVDATLDGVDATAAPHQKASFYSHNLQIGATYQFGEDRVEPVADPNPAGRDWYVSLFGGGVLPEDSGLTDYGYVDNVAFKTGYTVGVAVGTEVAPGLRGELEFSYMRYAADDYTYFRTQPPTPVSGDAELYYILANLWKDFDLGMGFNPYIGGGIGIGIADVKITAPVFPPLVDDTAVALAGQLGVGVRYALTDNWTLDAGYRFKGILDAAVEGDPAFFGPHVKASFFSHSFIGGLTYDF